MKVQFKDYCGTPSAGYAMELFEEKDSEGGGLLTGIWPSFFFLQITEYEPGYRFDFDMKYAVESGAPQQLAQLLEGPDNSYKYSATLQFHTTVNGFIYTPPFEEQQAAITDVEVCVYVDQVNTYHCDISAADGSYVIQIAENWIGLTQEARILPTYMGHEFINERGEEVGTAPLVTLRHRRTHSYDFQDIHSILLSGKVLVYPDLSSTLISCPVANAQVYKQNGQSVETQLDGSFAIAETIGASGILNVRMTDENGAELLDRIIVSEYKYTELLDDVSNIQFVDETVAEISTSLLGGNCGIDFVENGQVSLKMSNCDHVQTFPLGEVNGRTVRAQEYSITLDLESITLDIEVGRREDTPIPTAAKLKDELNLFMANTGQVNQIVDLRNGSAAVDYVFYAAPSIVIAQDIAYGMEGVNCELATFQRNQFELYGEEVHGVVQAGSKSNYVLFRADEVYGPTIEHICSMTGRFQLTDYVSSPSGEPLRATYEQEQDDIVLFTSHELLPISPNLYEPFFKLLTIKAVSPTPLVGDGTGEVTSFRTLNIVILGALRLEESFITTTSALPIMILRDPPGGRSHSEYQKSKQVTTFISLGAENTNGFGAEGSVQSGFAVENIPGVPDLEWNGGPQGEATVSFSYASANTLEMTIEFEKGISTNDDPGLAGELSDVIVGAGLIISYSLADNMYIDNTTCSVATKTVLLWDPRGIDEESGYIHSHFHIQHILIPKLEETMLLLAMDKKDKEYDDALKAKLKWEEILDYKKNLTNSAVPAFDAKSAMIKNHIASARKACENLVASFDYSAGRFNELNSMNIAESTWAILITTMISSLNVPALVFTAGYTEIPLYFDNFRNVTKHRNYDDLPGIWENFANDVEETFSEMEEWVDSFFGSKVSDYAIDGGAGAFEGTMVISSSETASISFETQFDSTLKPFFVENGLGAIEAESGFSFTGSATIGGGMDRSSTEVISTSYSVQDGNAMDHFVFEVLVDRVYGTPVFKLKEGRTSCPHEPGTDPVEKPQLTLISTNTPSSGCILEDSDEGFQFELTLANNQIPFISRAGGQVASGFYFLPDFPTLQGLEVKNDLFLNPLLIGLHRDAPLSLTFNAFKGPVEYDYQVRYYLFSACEWYENIIFLP